MMSKGRQLADLSDDEMAEEYRWFKRLIKRRPEELHKFWDSCGVIKFTPQEVFDEHRRRLEQRMESKGFEF